MRTGPDISNWQSEITPMRVAASGVTNPPKDAPPIERNVLLDLATGDVSCWKANGHDVAIVRASLETPAKSRLAQQQMDALIAGGFDVSVYGWVYWDWNPELTAQDISALIGDRPIRWVWWDMEDADNILSPSGIVAWMQRAISKTESLQLNTGTYTGQWFCDAYLGGNTDLSYRPLWTASYTGTPYQGMHGYNGWTQDKILAHQFSSTYPLCGRTLDMNGFSDAYFDFPPRGGQVEPPVTGDFDWGMVKPLVDRVYDLNREEHEAIDELFAEIRRQKPGAV